MKILLEDRLFSRLIKLRDKCKCVRCGTIHDISSKGLHCSHFWGRSNWATRYDEENCDTLCFACHNRWEENKQGEYRDFKLKQLGRQKYNELEKRAMSNARKITILTPELRRELKEKIKKYGIR